ncbi:MAG: sulfatase, partial [Candidatus Omnitrophota bacterium]
MKTHRRHFLKQTSAGMAGWLCCAPYFSSSAIEKAPSSRPNILFAIADDWSWPYAGAYGDKAVPTPTFDRVAREGVLFTQAFAAAPQCSPNRASILTGRSIWQNEEAGTHSSYFPQQLTVYPDILEEAGYSVGFTGKGWGPGNWKDAGRTRNPAGPEFNRRKLDSLPANGISNRDYAGNFKDFLATKPKDKPFCFWYGGNEPHRKYEKGSGLKAGLPIDRITVPPFLPDDPEIRSDILDYFLEVEWFDRQLGLIVQALEETGEIENTLFVVTSDNGMPFPGAKANLREYGLHMPLAIRWPKQIKGGRVIDDIVGFTSFAPTFLEAAGLHVPQAMSGRSFLPLLASNGSGLVDPGRNQVFAGRERHSHARYDNMGYPSRCLRTPDYLYIRNFKPERWPVGDPEEFYDVDDGPSKQFMLKNRSQENQKKLFELAFGIRPSEELFDIRKDPGCLVNLAANNEYEKIKNDLKNALESVLKEQGDPRQM